MTDNVRIATEVVRRLFDAGFIAYFAGGWVRDLLLGFESHEIDIATSAPPTKIQQLFPKTISVGIAFGVVIVVVENQNIEVTTFRKDHAYKDGRHPEGVDFSTPEKDALRRDFTINGMFYDPLTQQIYDYIGGREDLKKRIIRAIGNAKERFEEDRLRMIRAIRFASRFQFKIEKETENAIRKQAQSLFPSVSMERIWQELTKMASYPYFDHALLLLYQLGLLETIFPQLGRISLEQFKQRVAPFSYFPKNTPPIIYIMELFSELDLEDRIALCRYLKTSLKEMKWVESFWKGELLLKSEEDLAEWTRFYALIQANLFLEVQAAKILPPARLKFVEFHTQRQKHLRFFIERIRRKQPILTAEHLMQEGIPEGKYLGILLKEAENLAIRENIKDPALLLKCLKSSTFWRKSS
jgi:poly(A) polymerase